MASIEFLKNSLQMTSKDNSDLYRKRGFIFNRLNISLKYTALHIEHLKETTK